MSLRCGLGRVPCSRWRGELRGGAIDNVRLMRCPRMLQCAKKVVEFGMVPQKLRTRWETLWSNPASLMNAFCSAAGGSPSGALHAAELLLRPLRNTHDDHGVMFVRKM